MKKKTLLIKTKEIMKIKQHTPEWHTAKLSKIGASEIFSLVAHYCKDELKKANIDLGIEKAYKTPLELYLKVKFGVQDDSFSEVNREFGLGMEDYILYRLRQEQPKDDWGIDYEGSKSFIVNEKVSHLASCSPDGYVYVEGGEQNDIADYDKKTLINCNWGQGVLELKTTPYGFNFEADKGLKWSYIFQLQYQMLVCAKKWGILAAIAPKEKNYDTDFFKGKVLGKIEIKNQWEEEQIRVCTDKSGGRASYNAEGYIYPNFEDYYNLYHYIYPENKTIQNLCILALKRFQKALDGNILPNLSIDSLERLQREKKLLAKMYPDKYGTLKADEELEGLLKDEREANTQSLKDKTERENYICEIIEKMGNHIELVGSEFTARFSKKGSLLFSKTKGEK